METHCKSVFLPGQSLQHNTYIRFVSSGGISFSLFVFRAHSQGTRTPFHCPFQQVNTAEVDIECFASTTQLSKPFCNGDDDVAMKIEY